VRAERLPLTPSTSPSLSSTQFDECELMQQWFDVVHEKNVLAGYESELVIQLVLTIRYNYSTLCLKRYGDGAGNTVEENSGIFFLMR